MIWGKVIGALFVLGVWGGFWLWEQARARARAREQSLLTSRLEEEAEAARSLFERVEAWLAQHAPDQGWEGETSQLRWRGAGPDGMTLTVAVRATEALDGEVTLDAVELWLRAPELSACWLSGCTIEGMARFDVLGPDGQRERLMGDASAEEDGAVMAGVWGLFGLVSLDDVAWSAGDGLTLRASAPGSTPAAVRMEEVLEELFKAAADLKAQSDAQRWATTPGLARQDNGWLEGLSAVYLSSASGRAIRQQAAALLHAWGESDAWLHDAASGLSRSDALRVADALEDALALDPLLETLIGQPQAMLRQCRAEGGDSAWWDILWRACDSHAEVYPSRWGVELVASRSRSTRAARLSALVAALVARDDHTSPGRQRRAPLQWRVQAVARSLDIASSDDASSRAAGVGLLATLVSFDAMHDGPGSTRAERLALVWACALAINEAPALLSALAGEASALLSAIAGGAIWDAPAVRLILSSMWRPEWPKTAEVDAAVARVLAQCPPDALDELLEWVEECGGAACFQAVVALIETTPSKPLLSVRDAMHARLIEGGKAGALSVAEGQGGELTIAADARGGVSLTDA